MRILFTLCLLISSCSVFDSSSKEKEASAVWESWAEACVNQINEYRLSEGLPTLDRWKDQEGCTNDAARSDSKANEAHGSFGNCTELAQNECPGWPSIESTVDGCLEMMWNERELPVTASFSERGHYLNMSSTKYTKVACGFYETENGKIWAVQNFK